MLTLRYLSLTAVVTALALTAQPIKSHAQVSIQLGNSSYGNSGPYDRRVHPTNTQPSYSTPQYSTPQYSTPQYSTPQYPSQSFSIPTDSWQNFNYRLPTSSYFPSQQRYSNRYRGSNSLPNQPYNSTMNGQYNENDYNNGPYYRNTPHRSSYYGTQSQQRGATIGGAIGDAVGGQRAGNIGAAIGSAIGNE